jgi:hypothetical protein
MRVAPGRPFRLPNPCGPFRLDFYGMPAWAEPLAEAPACSRFRSCVVCCCTALALFWALREARFAMPVARLPTLFVPFSAPELLRLPEALCPAAFAETPAFARAALLTVLLALLSALLARSSAEPMVLLALFSALLVVLFRVPVADEVDGVLMLPPAEAPAEGPLIPPMALPAPLTPAPAVPAVAPAAPPAAPPSCAKAGVVIATAPLRSAAVTNMMFFILNLSCFGTPGRALFPPVER